VTVLIRRVLCLMLVTFGCDTAWDRDGTRETFRVDFEVDEGTNLSFDLSPDGKTIVFDLLGQLWRLPSEGGTATAITKAGEDRADDVEPSFSPDGATIAFQGFRRSGAGIFRVALDGGIPERLTSDVLSERLRRLPGPWPHLSPSWSPDGRYIIYSLTDSIFQLDVLTGAVVSIPVTLPRLNGASAYLGPAESSPDGDHIVFGTGGGLAFRSYIGAQASIWEVAFAGGPANRLTPEDVRAVAPAVAPSGKRIAYFAPDSLERWQLWVQDLESGSRSRLTQHEDMTTRRVRWDPSGSSLFYSADGRLWRVPAAGGEPGMIPFVARIEFERVQASLPQIEFPEPGAMELARGFSGVAISNDGSRLAMLTLGALWVGPLRGPVARVGPVPEGAMDLVWTPDDEEVLLTDGDVMAVDVGTGVVRRLTQLNGTESVPSLSPDGSRLAFLHQNRVRVALTASPVVRGLDQTSDLGPARAMEGAGSPLAWSSDSRALLVYSGFAYSEPGLASARLVSLDGSVDSLSSVPRGGTFVNWDWSRGLVYSAGNRLWSAPLDLESGSFDEATPLSDRPALNVSVSRDGHILYVSDNGLEVRTATGVEETLGWPVRYEARSAPRPLVVTNARIIDGTGAPPADAADILVESARIRAIGAPGTLPGTTGADTLDAGGRILMPGLIDLHRHLIAFQVDAKRQVAGALYYGTTTVRDVGSLLSQTAAVRDLVRSGSWNGARVVLGGFAFDGREVASGSWASDVDQLVTDSAEVARGIAIARAFGADYVKHLGGTEAWGPMVTEAHSRGMRISGHCSGLILAIASGVDGQEHAGSCFRDTRTNIYDDIVRLKAESGVWVVATAGTRLDFLRVYDDPSLLERPDFLPFVPEVRRDAFRAPAASMIAPIFRRDHERYMGQTARLYEAGVLIATGSDSYTPDAVHSDLAALVEAGLSPLKAITAGTSAAARVLGADESLGTIEVGKLADFLILDADPLEDIHNTKRIWSVIQGGRVIDRDSILARVRTLPGGG